MSKGIPPRPFKQILQAIDELPTNQRSSGWKISAARACESLELSSAVGLDAKSQAAFAKSLLKQNTILELDGVSQNTKKFLIPLLCYWIYFVQLASDGREKLKFVIFLEEAHHTVYRHEARAKETLMNVLLRQCRELGIGMVLIDQHPHLISSAGLGNCYTTICMNLKDPSDINKAAGLSGLEEGDRRFFNSLSVGQAIVKLQDRWRQPFLVQFPLVDAKKGFVTDELLGKIQKGEIPLAKLRESAGAKARVAARSRSRATPVDDGSVRLLHDIAQHPEDGVDTRYKRLGVSADKGNRWKEQLIQNGLVSPDRVKTNRTYRVLLRLTNEARLLLTPQKGQDPQASFFHEYWKRRIAHQFEKDGFKVTLEALRPRGGGNIDISATRGSENVAIEIETGKSDAVSNVKRDLLSGFQKVIVVATNHQALEKVERQLAQAGLLIPERVEIVFSCSSHYFF